MALLPPVLLPRAGLAVDVVRTARRSFATAQKSGEAVVPAVVLVRDALRWVALLAQRARSALAAREVRRLAQEQAARVQPPQALARVAWARELRAQVKVGLQLVQPASQLSPPEAEGELAQPERPAPVVRQPRQAFAMPLWPLRLSHLCRTWPSLPRQPPLVPGPGWLLEPSPLHPREWN